MAELVRVSQSKLKTFFLFLFFPFFKVFKVAFKSLQSYNMATAILIPDCSLDAADLIKDHFLSLGNVTFRAECLHFSASLTSVSGPSQLP